MNAAKARRIIAASLWLLALRVWGKEFTLNEVLVRGLERTRPSTVLAIAGLKPGMAVDETTPDSVRQKLLLAKIFRNDVTVDLLPLDDARADLEISLSDRWTFLPLPVGFVSSSGWLAGAVFVESNMAGLNQALVGGVFFSGERVLGFAAWRDPSFGGSPYSLGVGASFYDGISEHMTPDGAVTLASFDQVRFSGSVRVGRKYGNGFSWEGNTGLFSLSASDGQGYLPSYPLSKLYWQNGLALRWDKLYFVSFFNEGWTARLEGTLYADAEKPEVSPSLKLSLAHSFLVGGRHLFRGSMNAGWQSFSDFSPLLIGGSEGSRALPSGEVAAISYVSGTLAFEPVLSNLKWGIFTFPVYYEGGLYRPLHDGPLNYWHGPGFGFRFYIDKVAIPALGADFTWNLQTGTFKVVVTLGQAGGL